MVKITDELSARFANMSFVCACLVVLLHETAEPVRGSALWWAQALFGAEGVAKIAVPYFFLASGFFLARRIRDDGLWYDDAVTKRIRSLLLPFLLWNAIGWLFLLIVVGFAESHGIKTGLKLPVCTGWVDAAAHIGLHPLRTTAHPHTWFLRSLFVNVLVSPLIAILIRRAKAWTIVLVALALAGLDYVAVVLGAPALANFAKFIFSIEGLVYFSAGMLICLKWDRLKLPRTVSRGLALSGWILVAAKPIVALTADPAHGVGWHWLLDYAGRALLIYAVWLAMPSRRVFGNLTDCSFALYMMHRFTLLLSFGLLGVTGFKDVMMHSSVSLYFGRAAFSIAVICALTKVLRRLLPRAASVLFGGR